MNATNCKIATTLCLFAGLSLASCVSSSEYERLQAQYDSIAQANEQYRRDFEVTDSVLHQMMSFFGDFNQLSYLISINDAGQMSYRTAQKRIQENVDDLTIRMLQSQESIDSLTQRLRESNNKNQVLESLLRNFRSAVVAGQSQITTAKEASLKQIGRMASLSNTASKLRQEVKSLQQAQIQTKDEWLEDRAHLLEDMNRVRFCIGTSSDLKELGVMKGKVVSVSSVNFDYFTESDARLMHDLELHSSKAKLHSIHPTGSYDLVKGEDGKLTLVIKDRTSFWAYSRTLIVEVD